MEIYSKLIENKDLIKTLYGFLISLICLIIVLKTDRLFRLSMHQGIRNFRNAFFFFGLAFFSRYLLGIFFNFTHLEIIFFEFFLIVGGFFLLHSLIWRKFKSIEQSYFSSLFSPVTILFYLMASILVLLDYLQTSYLFLFLSQIILFLLASILSFKNYQNNFNKPFPKFYFLAMILSLSAWILNAIAGIFFEWNSEMIINSYILNLMVFTLFLFGVIKITSK